MQDLVPEEDKVGFGRLRVLTHDVWLRCAVLFSRFDLRAEFR